MRNSKFAFALALCALGSLPVLGQLSVGGWPEALSHSGSNQSLVAALVLAPVQDQIKIGSLKFTPPKGWKPTSATSRVLLAFAPPDLPTGKVCQVRVFADEVSKEAFDAWFKRRWNALMSGKPKLRTSETLSQKVESADVLVRSGAYEEGSGEAYALIIAGSVGGHYVLVAYEANDYPLMEKHQDEVYGMFGTMDLDTGGAPPTGDPATTNPPAENPKGSTPNPRPASAPAYKSGDPKQESERINRLSEIARLLQDPKEDTVALLTEAARLCGFAIWTEDRAKIADPSGAPRLKLAVTDAEIREYAEMFRTGDSVVLKDLIAMVDVVYAGIGSKPSCGPMIMEWLQNGGRSENPSVRALTSFLQSLGAYRGGGSASLFKTGNESLDPIQSLLILRVVTEEIGEALRKALAKEKPPPRSASFNHTQQAGEAPGWAEDAFAGGITGLWDHLTPGTGLEAYGEKVGKANAILSIIKFIATYVFLKGDVRVEAPGQPLIRTMDFHAGEVRKVVARFWIDGMKVTDWMKDHRVLVALAGLDLDMPKTGALKGVPTDWAVDQSNLVAHQLIKTTGGTGALHNRMTDEKGEASVEWEGFPQPVVLDPKKVMPMPKQARITVIPSVKEIGMQQDLVDAVTGAIGIKGGPVGFITPLMEMLYRLKWTGSASLVLQVRDWSQADTIGQLSISMRENWSRIRNTTAERHTIDRSLVYTDVGMQVIGGEPPPAPDPGVFAHATPLERQQMEAWIKQQAEMAKKRVFNGERPGAMRYSINDLRWKRSPADECGDTDETTTTTTWIGSDTRAYAPTDKFQVSVDLEKMIVTVSADSLLKVKFVEITKTGKITGRQDKDDVKSIFFGLKLLPPFDRDEPIEIPLKETKVIDSDATNYYGAVTIPFTYGKVTEYKGNIIFSYSVTRKVVKPK